MNWLKVAALGFSVSGAMACALACDGTSSLGTSDERQEGNDGGGTGGRENSGGATGSGGAVPESGGRASTGGVASGSGGSAATGGKSGSGGASPATGGLPGTGGSNPDEDCADRACAPLPPSCPSGQWPGSTPDNCCVRCLPPGTPTDECPEGEVLVSSCEQCGLAGGCTAILWRCRPAQDCASGTEPCAEGALCSQGACVDFGVWGCI